MTLLAYLSNPMRSFPVLWMFVAQSLDFFVVLVDHCLSVRLVSFVQCIVAISSIYGFGLLRWYLQTFLQPATISPRKDGLQYPPRKTGYNIHPERPATISTQKDRLEYSYSQTDQHPVSLVQHIHTP